MEGILKEVNGALALIDSKWYKVQKPGFLPKDRDVRVSFSTLPEAADTIKFIKVMDGTAAAKPFVKKTYGTVSKEAAPATTSAPTASAAKPVARQTGYGSPEDVRGKEVGCAINAAAQILSGSVENVEVILKKMKDLVEGILRISQEEKSK